MTRCRIVRAPEQYSGSLREFAERFVAPNLLDPQLVAHYHRLLVDYVNAADPLLLVRQVRGTERRETYRTTDGSRFKATDNAPSWWMHYAIFSGVRLTPTEFAAAIADAPAHMFDAARVIPDSISKYGWHVAHIFPVKSGDIDYLRWRRPDVTARFLRNVHPCNYFYIAKTDWQQWGGNERVIGQFAGQFAERYADVWGEFVRMARGDRSTLARTTGEIHYEYGAPIGTPDNTVGVAVEQASSANDTAPCYHARRLLFKASVIEPLEPHQRFRVVTPVGTFDFSKADFYRVFSNVVESRSYREHGIYHYSSVPAKALEFLSGGA